MTIKLDKHDIIASMWDGCNGSHVLAVAPDGGDHSIHWMEDNRQRDPWPDGWVTIGIPAIDPDGSGQAINDAEDLLRALGLRKSALTLMEAEDIGWIEAVEKLSPDDWEANREMAWDWLADAFLAACNGDGGDLDRPAPWGYKGDIYGGDNLKAIEPPAEFEWATQKTDSIGLVEAAEITGIAYGTLAKAVKEGRVEARRFRTGDWLVTVASIEAAIAAGRMRKPH